MTATEQIGGLVEKTASLLDRATETTFFLHLLCLALHLDICISTVTRKPLGDLAWSELENLSPAVLLGTLVSYCFLMGFAFRFGYGLLALFAVRLLPWGLFPDRFLPPKDGYISREEAWQHAHTAKSFDVVRMFDEHQAAWWRHRRTISDLAELSFAACALLIVDHFFADYGLLINLEKLLPVHSSHTWHNGLLGASLFLLGWIIWIDVDERPSQRAEYMYYPPLFEELRRHRQEKESQRTQLLEAELGRWHAQRQHMLEREDEDD